MAAARALRIGSLCTGYGGLDMAVDEVFGPTELAWVSEIEPHACKIIEAHRPDVRNLGDLTKHEWVKTEPVDILTAGYPCQPFSQAGLRKGTDDERHLWPYISNAIGVLRPSVVVLENVAGHLSLGGPAVVGSLAALRYDTRWMVVRASDVGACHRRTRLFILATRTDANSAGLRVVERQQPGLGTWRNADGLRPQDRLLPTPVVNDMGDGKTPEWWDQWTAEQQAKTGNGNGHGKSLAQEIMRLLPTPTTDDASNVTRASGDFQSLVRTVAECATDFGEYEPAIRRHEATLGRRAPHPVDDQGRLSPLFVEWMMMLAPGHVTDTVTSRTAALRALGNGVVPAQAAHALRLLTMEAAA